MAEKKATPKAKKVSPITPKASSSATSTPVVEAESNKLHRRSMVGLVTSDKMMKTRVVRVERQVKSGTYGKYITKSGKFKVHDENNLSKTGDLVSIVESRPLSRDKRWALQKILRSASGEVLTKI